MDDIVWCQYLSPFAGAKPYKAVSSTDPFKQETNQHSYGMWAVPPDIDTSVVVIFVKGENKHIDSIDHKVGISKDIVLEDGSYILINIHALLPQDFKKLNETRGKVIADFQKLLEKEWLVDLKSKYSVKINKKALYSLIK